MQEEYLHYLWRMKRLKFNDLKLTDHSSIDVLDPGWYNLDAGPDFFNGSVQIDGINWYGNIELHIQSSDWYAHGHQNDTSYNNVILHVVYNHDKEVLINGKPIPTLELKNQIDDNHHSNYLKILKSRKIIPCADVLMNHKKALENQIEKSFFHRLERKGLELLNQSSQNDRYSLFLRSIFQAVAGRVNKLPMQELASILPYQMIWKEAWSQKRIEALVFGCSGLLRGISYDEYSRSLWEEWLFLKRKYNLSEMNKKSWKFGGVRPPSFPTVIIAQVCALIPQFPFQNHTKRTAKEWMEVVGQLSPRFIHNYWKTHYVFGKLTTDRKVSFSSQFKQNLIINGLVPFFSALKHSTNDFIFQYRALELITATPPEKNRIINEWKEIGIKPKNALETQGLLELKNEFCTFKKCLSCEVGKESLQ